MIVNNLRREPPGQDRTARKRGLFSLGRIVATSGALKALEPHPGLGLKLLLRHVTGDWSEMHPADQERNRRAVSDGDFILSSYSLPDGEQIWLITEADRQVTTFLLPHEH